MPAAVTIELLSYVPLRDRASLEGFLALLAAAPDIVPTEWGMDERSREPYDPGARLQLIEEAMAWKGSALKLMLRRRKTISYEAWFDCYTDGLGKVGFDFTPGPAEADLPRLFEFADALMRYFKPALGFIHRYWRIGERSQSYDASAGANIDTLQKYGLSPVCTRTWYGPQLTELIGLPLLKSSGARVEETPWPGVRIDLVERPWEVEPEQLAAEQERVMKTLLTSGAYGDLADFMARKPGPRWTPLADTNPILPKARWAQPPPIPEAYQVVRTSPVAVAPVAMPANAPRQYPAVVVDLKNSLNDSEPLTSADISDLDLSRIDLTDVNTERLLANRTVLKGAFLTGARLFEALMEDSVLTRAHLEGANLGMSYLTRVDLHDANLRRCSFTLGRCDHCDFTEADLSDSDLTETSFPDCDLTNAKLQKVRGDGTFFGRSKLVDADLSGSSFVGAVFRDADLSGADLTGTDLSQADCSSADFRGAKLAGVNWTETQLQDARFDIGAYPVRG